jgi:hypothetical protein
MLYFSWLALQKKREERLICGDIGKTKSHIN